MNQLGDARKQSFKLPTNPMKNPRLADKWEPYLQEKREESARLTPFLTAVEAELNVCVYPLSNLTSDEAKLLQREVEHREPRALATTCTESRHKLPIDIRPPLRHYRGVLGEIQQ